jgi:hypothetical protein
MAYFQLRPVLGIYIEDVDGGVVEGTGFYELTVGRRAVLLVQLEP